MAGIGTEIYVEIRGQKYKARVIPTPFYKKAARNEPRSVSTD
jgi:glycine cleavage system aminomethyltransferase T